MLWKVVTHFEGGGVVTDTSLSPFAFGLAMCVFLEGGFIE